ncbi:MAG: hypothetical protein AB7I25_13355 [Vicinamibacterales bacterium]
MQEPGTNATAQGGLLHAAEEAPNPRAYPPAYRPVPVADQLARLRPLFPRLHAGTLAAPAALPAGAEGWFVVPDWRRVAPLYNTALRDALAVLARVRETSLSRIDRIGPDRLRQSERSVAMGGTLAPAPGSDYLVIAAQFGARHAGHSIRHAREMFAAHEFGLGAFALACMLLTHPERLAQADQLYIDGAGDEYSASDEAQFSEAPFFRFLDGKVSFGTSWIGYADPYFGSASAFLAGFAG